MCLVLVAAVLLGRGLRWQWVQAQMCRLPLLTALQDPFWAPALLTQRPCGLQLLLSSLGRSQPAWLAP
jgi:hypothetical protein